MEEKNRRTPNHQQTKKNTFIFALLFLFFIGMIYGVLILRESTTYNWLYLYASQYVSAMQVRSVLQNFFYSFTSIFFYLLAAYVLGYSAIAQPVILLIPLFKGLGLGTYMGYLYFSYGLRGIGCCILIVLPSELIALFSVIIACREATKLSVMLFSEFITGRAAPLTGGVMKLYHIKFLILCIFAIFSAFINTIGVLLFWNLFHFK